MSDKAHGAEGAETMTAGPRPADSLALWGDFTALRMRHLRRLGIDPADIDVLLRLANGPVCEALPASLESQKEGAAV